MSKDISSFIGVDVLFYTHFQKEEDSHGAERNGKVADLSDENGSGKASNSKGSFLAAACIKEAAKKI